MALLLALQVSIAWVVQSAVEYIFWTVVLPPLAPHVARPTQAQWSWLLLLNAPGIHLVLQYVSDVMFHVVPRWHAAWLSFNQTELRYVTAPKGSMKSRLARVANSIRNTFSSNKRRSGRDSDRGAQSSKSPGSEMPGGTLIEGNVNSSSEVVDR